jgi:hypothetical protein
VIEIESVVSTALRLTTAAVVDWTVKVALPDPLVVPGEPVMVTPLAGEAVRVTDFEGTG